MGRIRRWLVGSAAGVALGSALLGTVQTARAVPPFRTVLDIGTTDMRDKVYFGFGIEGRGEICTTYFTDGPLGLQSQVQPTPGYEGLLTVVVVDTQGRVVANVDFRGTDCRELRAPAGSYYLQAIRSAGVFRLEVYDYLR